MARRLRSPTVRTALLGASAFALSACGDTGEDLTYFETVEQCRSAAFAEPFSPEDCDAAFAQAREKHEVLAPRYESRALCEEQHGEEACVVADEADATAAEDGQGSVFMPLLAGYMMGSMLSGNRYGAAPLYRDASGRVLGAGGRPYAFQGPGSTVRGSAAAVQPLAAATRPPPVMTRAMIAERGGFGAARTSAAGRTGFGG
jgi:uncharacterized protein YgiB involved in biofilm formation